jgi:hypothetical protein
MRRRAVAHAIERQGYRCVAVGVGGIACAGPLDAHEPLFRSRGGDACDPGEIVLVCRAHHEWCHEHPLAAKAHGLAVSGAVLYADGRYLRRRDTDH